MPVQPTYPGVYVQEVPSGVRTIIGVGTSIAMFIGRAKQGAMNVPVLCLNFSDFDRVFSADYANSDLARAVRLFFQNGGSQCYVMRIADDTAASAGVTLRNEAQVPVLRATAKSAGLVGEGIRLAVTYKGPHPESTFNLEVFRWESNSSGQLVKTDLENWNGLSMDPASSRYAATYVTQNSSLIALQDLAAGPAAQGYSRTGRPVPRRTDTIFRDHWRDLIGTTSVDDTNQFRISVDGGSFVNVDLSGIDFSTPPLETVSNAVANLPGEIESVINNSLPAGASVTVTMETGPEGPSGQDNETSVLLQIASDNGNVRIEPSAMGDLAKALMMGSAQGGLEVAKYANVRPAPNGIVFDVDNLVALAGLQQDAFRVIHIDTADIDLANSLETTGSGDPMYRDDFSTSNTENNDGVREKWSIIAQAINNERASNPAFGWSAEVWGNRLALIPVSGGDNTTHTLTTSGGGGTNIGDGGLDHFTQNVRYYSLGTSGMGIYQENGAPGNDGGAPAPGDYRDAYTVIEKEVDLFNLLVLPRDADHTAADTSNIYSAASIFCQEQRAFLLMDPPDSWTDVQKATDPASGVNSLRVGLIKDHSAIFYPNVTLRENGLKVHVGPSGAIAGLMARIDSNRGVWKAPAGTEADLRGIVGLQYRFSDNENGVLNPQGINTLRVFPNGIVNWGARTMDGDDDFASEWKYIPVRRTALFIEESLYRGLKWVVFEPNDEALWAQIRLNVGAFMHNLFRQGAFQGTKKDDAYFVKCDKETTTQNDINMGIVNIWVGFAPLKPAEFVILRLQQMAGQIEV